MSSTRRNTDDFDSHWESDNNFSAQDRFLFMSPEYRCGVKLVDVSLDQKLVASSVKSW